VTTASSELGGVQQFLGELASAATPAPQMMSSEPGVSFATALDQASGELGAAGGLFIGYDGPSSAASPSSGGWGAQFDLAALSGSNGGWSSSAGVGSIATAPPLAARSVAGGVGQAVTREALAYQGTPYVWGGASPGGFDCSGFVQYVYAKLGVSLPRTSEEQAGAGTAVNSLSAAQPGDLLFFAGSDGTASAPGHVAIYLGHGEMIDAPYTGTSVRVESVATAGTVVAIRRVVGA